MCTPFQVYALSILLSVLVALVSLEWGVMCVGRRGSEGGAMVERRVGVREKGE